jgi:hypothetical protein
MKVIIESDLASSEYELDDERHGSKKKKGKVFCISLIYKIF